MFKTVENHEYYYHVKESEEYGIGIYPVLFGFRVRIWDLHSPTVICDLCFGADPMTVNLGYMILLEYLNKGGDPYEIPKQEVKPYPQPCKFTDWMNTFADTNYLGKIQHITQLDLIEYRNNEFSKVGL